MASFFDGEIEKALAAKQAQAEFARAKRDHESRQAAEEQRKAEEIRVKVEAKWTADVRIVEEIVRAINAREDLGIVANVNTGVPLGDYLMTIRLTHKDRALPSLVSEVRFTKGHRFTVQDNPAGGLDEFLRYGRDSYSHYVGQLLQSMLTAAD